MNANKSTGGRSLLAHHVTAVFGYLVVGYWALPLNETTQGWMILAALAGTVFGAQLMIVVCDPDGD
mgnify:CR=1 FL=1